jgi:hypothetical protein
MLEAPEIGPIEPEVTVTTYVEYTVPQVLVNESVIVVVPAETPVTTPVLLIVATLVVLLLHTPPPPVPPVALSARVIVDPTHTSVGPVIG